MVLEKRFWQCISQVWQGQSVQSGLLGQQRSWPPHIQAGQLVTLLQPPPPTSVAAVRFTDGMPGSTYMSQGTF